MAHQVSSSSLGSSLAHHSGLARVPSSANTAHLDLNLSQKASPSPFKVLVDPEKVFEAPVRSHSESIKKAARVATTVTNGCVILPTGEPKHAHGPARAAPNEASHNWTAVAEEDELPTANDTAPLSASRKRNGPRAETAANAEEQLLPSRIAVLEDSSNPENGTVPTSPSRKRKSPLVQQAIDDPAKKVILALEANEDEGLPKPRGRTPRGHSNLSNDVFLGTPRSRKRSLVAVKSETPDLAERRLLLEERKLRLAERRFALEEKKLEATIEIGKGLIVSMERMTDTLSGLAGFSSHFH